MKGEKKLICYGKCSSSLYKFWTMLCNMVYHIMNHLWRQDNYNKNKNTKTNQHICRYTIDWSSGLTKLVEPICKRFHYISIKLLVGLISDKASYFSNALFA